MVLYSPPIMHDNHISVFFLSVMLIAKHIQYSLNRFFLSTISSIKNHLTLFFGNFHIIKIAD